MQKFLVPRLCGICLAAVIALLIYFIFENYENMPQEVRSSECSHEPDRFRCVSFLSNYDADTITVNIPGTHPLIGKKISVRVLGIDAPEIRGKEACEKKKAFIARDFVAKVLSSANKLEIHHLQRDKYFRILGDVMVDDKNLKDMLLAEGLAKPYDGGSKKNIHWCP